MLHTHSEGFYRRSHRRMFRWAVWSLAGILAIGLFEPHFIFGEDLPPKATGGLLFERYDSVQPVGQNPLVNLFTTDYRSHGPRGVWYVDVHTKEISPVFVTTSIGWGTAGLSPNGRFLSYVTYEYAGSPRKRKDTLHVRDLVRGKERLYSFGKANLHVYRWAPDSRRLATRSFVGRTYEYQYVTDKAQHEISILRIPEDPNSALNKERTLQNAHWLPAFAPNGDGLAYMKKDHEIVVENAGDVTATISPRYHTPAQVPRMRTYWGPKWSPDGSRLLLLGSGLTLISLEESDPNYLKPSVARTSTVHVPDPPSPVSEPTLTTVEWSPDSKRIAHVAIREPRVWALNLCSLYVRDLKSRVDRAVTLEKKLPSPSAIPRPIFQWGLDSSSLAWAQHEEALTASQLSAFNEERLTLELWMADLSGDWPVRARLTSGHADLPIRWLPAAPKCTDMAE
jgi:hypothetical protein